MDRCAEPEPTVPDPTVPDPTVPEPTVPEPTVPVPSLQPDTPQPTYKKVEQVDGFYIFQCPHCEQTICVHRDEVNCKIFRCGSYKANGQPIHPHTPKPECDRLKAENLIYGCGKPFIFDHVEALVCGYV